MAGKWRSGHRNRVAQRSAACFALSWITATPSVSPDVVAFGYGDARQVWSGRYSVGRCYRTADWMSGCRRVGHAKRHIHWLPHGTFPRQRYAFYASAALLWRYCHRDRAGLSALRLASRPGHQASESRNPAALPTFRTAFGLASMAIGATTVGAGRQPCRGDQVQRRVAYQARPLS